VVVVTAVFGLAVVATEANAAVVVDASVVDVSIANDVEVLTPSSISNFASVLVVSESITTNIEKATTARTPSAPRTMTRFFIRRLSPLANARYQQAMR
jgi:hypothetical protein